MASKLRRRVQDLLIALDPTAAPPHRSLRSAAARDQARRHADQLRATERLVEDHPEFLDLCHRLDRTEEESPEWHDLLDRMLAILAGEPDPGPNANPDITEPKGTP